MNQNVSLTNRPAELIEGRTLTGRKLLSAWLSGRKATTVRAYRSDLAGFASFAGAPDPETALAELLALPHGEANGRALDYRNAMVDGGLSPATVNRRLAALRSIVSLARTLGAISWALDVPGVGSEAYRDTRGPGKAGVSAMLAAVSGSSVREIRNRAIVRLLFDVALRRGELVALDLADLDLDGGSIDVLGKGRTERIRLTLPEPTVSALREWIEVRGAGAGPLFRNLDRAGKGSRLTGHSVARIVAELGIRAGLGTVRPHGLRHAAITEALDVTNGNVRAVQRFSRHKSLAVLNRYDDNRADLGGEIARLVAAGA